MAEAEAGAEAKRVDTAAAGAGGDTRLDATPMVAQYLEIKSANTHCLLSYRMGDF
jgi:hypothetical protein